MAQSNTPVPKTIFGYTNTTFVLDIKKNPQHQQLVWDAREPTKIAVSAPVDGTNRFPFMQLEIAQTIFE